MSTKSGGRSSVVAVPLIVVIAVAALVFPQAGVAARRSARDDVVVLRAKVHDQRVLLHLLRVSTRVAFSESRAAGGVAHTSEQPVAGIAKARQPFRILRDGYLPRSAYRMAVGRLYAVSANGHAISACTASVVGPNVVLTAAHCVHDTETHHDYGGFLFVPGMRRSSEPVGAWTGSSATYWSGWARAPRVSLDYAFVTLDANQSGQNVGDVTGFYKIVEHARPHRVLTEGYPGTGPFSRHCTLTSCLATYCYSPLGGVFRGAYGNVLSIGCVTGQGSSGGPWFVAFHGHPAIASVTSVGLGPRRANYFRIIFGPQFGSGAATLLRAAQNR
jgi:hypothetical protein